MVSINQMQTVMYFQIPSWRAGDLVLSHGFASLLCFWEILREVCRWKLQSFSRRKKHRRPVGLWLGLFLQTQCFLGRGPLGPGEMVVLLKLTSSSQFKIALWAEKELRDVERWLKVNKKHRLKCRAAYEMQLLLFLKLHFGAWNLEHQLRRPFLFPRGWWPSKFFFQGEEI